MKTIRMLKGAVISSLLSMLFGTFALAMPPLLVEKMSVDTVSLTQPAKVTITVLASPRLRNITARILDGEGYRVLSQPHNTVDSLPRGVAATFVGTLQPLAKGTWKVQVQALTRLGNDTAEVGANDEFYIFLSDTLDRAITGAEYILLQSPYGKTTWRPRPDRVIQGRPGPVAKPGRHGSVGDTCSTIPKTAKVIDTTRSKKAEPAPADSSIKKDSATKKVSGTFDVTGYLSYHDPRDPQGWLRPARNVDVEVWNDNEYDNPPSADVLLATGITDWYGCYSFWWLDISGCKTFENK